MSYLPAESDSGMFGGNSNWRGPIWMPVNVLIVRGLLNLYAFYGDDFTIECPTGSGNRMTLFEVAQEISRRLSSIFLRDASGRRPVYGGAAKFQDDPHWRDLVLFYEYFHGDNGAGLGASHQTGWTGVVARLLDLFGRVTGRRRPGDAQGEARGPRSSGEQVRRRPGDEPERHLGIPSLYQVNTRVRLSELSAELGRPATLDDVPDAELDRLAADGFDLVWFLGVWQTGEAARRVSRIESRVARGVRRVLPDLREEDICGSCFAVRDYRVHADFGGDEALARLRDRLQRAWPAADPRLRPEPHRAGPPLGGASTRSSSSPGPRSSSPRSRRTTAGSRRPVGAASWPTAATRTSTAGRTRCSWTTATRRSRRPCSANSRGSPGQCDGVRCDMAMLVLPEVFERTWGIAAAALLASGHGGRPRQVPDFLFLAEVYWDLEWTLQQQGFDYTYDKRLYDRLVEGDARPGP